MGFLRDETVTIDLALAYPEAEIDEDGNLVEDGTENPYATFYVKVKKYLSKTEFEGAQKKLTMGSERMTMKTKGEGRTEDAEGITEMSLDSASYQTEMVARSIVEWNLTDEDNKPLPYRPMPALLGSLGRIPQPAFAYLAKKVGELNRPRSKKAKVDFRSNSQRPSAQSEGISQIDPTVPGEISV